MAAMAASAAVAPAVALAVAVGFAALLARGGCFDRFRAGEEALQPSEETAGRLCGLGSAARRLAFAMLRPLVAGIARLAHFAGVPRLASVAGIPRLAGVAGIARLTGVAGIARLALE